MRVFEDIKQDMMQQFLTLGASGSSARRRRGMIRHRIEANLPEPEFAASDGF